MANKDAYMNNNNNEDEEKEEAAISQNSFVAAGRTVNMAEMVGWLGEETTKPLALFRQGQSDPEVKCCLWTIVLQK